MSHECYPSVSRALADSFQQQEKTEVLQSLRDLTASIRDMKNYVNEIFTRTYNIEQKMGGGATAGGVQSPQDLSSIKNYLWVGRVGWWSVDAREGGFQGWDTKRDPPDSLRPTGA